MFGTKYQLSKAESASTRMTIGNTKVQAADQICNLGFFMDYTLKSGPHKYPNKFGLQSDAQHMENMLKIGL